MPGKRVQFNDEMFEATLAVVRQRGRTFQQLADESFKDLLKKHGQPVGLRGGFRAKRRRPA
jgi:hypothetical protein